MAKLIKVNLISQVVEAFENEKPKFKFDCVTGDADHPTSKGSFKVFRKNHPYTSKTYKVPMNYALFFTADGQALHQYHGPGGLGLVRVGRKISDWFGSHGCVRLSESDARELYNWASVGTKVVVY